MGTITDQIELAFRDHIVQGVVTSGLRDVDKSEVRAIGPLIESAVANSGLGALLAVTYATRAELEADLDHPADSVGLVYGDATQANNDLYIKSGASGSGSWTLTTAFNDIVASLTNAPVARAQNSVPFETWSDLEAATLMQAGDRATVVATDSGSHTDPVVGGTVPNSGYYVYSTSPAGWERVADLDSELAQTEADRAAGFAAEVDVAGGVLAVRDAAEIHKNNAEAAQALAQAAAIDTAADAVSTASDRAAAAQSASDAATTAANLVPYSAIAQSQLYTANGSVNINGTGGTIPAFEYAVAIGPQTGADSEPLRGANINTENPVAIGPWAMAEFNGYNSLGLGWRALRFGTGRNSIAIGVHSGEAVNYSARNVHGFGVRASGSISFTGQPSADDTVTLNGVIFTAKASASSSGEFSIGADVAETIENLLAEVIASNSNDLKGYIFAATATTLEVLADGGGTYGNAFTLATSGGSLARSGATLSGGTLTTGTDNQDTYQGFIAIGVSAGKRNDPRYSRKAYGAILVDGSADIGATLTIGVSATVSTAAATSKRFVCVASGASGLQFNQGSDAASQTFELYKALSSYKASNPSHVALSAVDIYASARGVEFVHTQAGTSSNAYRLQVTGANLDVTAPTLSGGDDGSNVAPIAIGQDSENANLTGSVIIGRSAGGVAQGSNLISLGSSSGQYSIGDNNFYMMGSGQRVIGSNNQLFGTSLGGASVRDYASVSAVSSGGLITMAAPHSDKQLRVGNRLIFAQRNQTSASDLIKRDGSNLSQFGAVVVSPTQLQILDFDDGAGAAGDAVYSVTTDASNVELAPQYAELDNATSFGDAPESSVFHIGRSTQERAQVRSKVLDVATGRMIYDRLTALGSFDCDEGEISFTAAALDGESVIINGVTFLAETGGLNTRFKFPPGANQSDTVNNLLDLIRRNDEPQLRGLRFRTERIGAATVKLIFAVLSTTKAGTIAYSTNVTGATASGSVTSGAVSGALPLIADDPELLDGELRLIDGHPWLGTTFMKYDASDDAWQPLNVA